MAMNHPAAACEMDPVTDGSLEDVLSRLKGLYANAVKHRELLEAAGDRAFGGRPTPIAHGALDAPKASGLTYQVSEMLTKLAGEQDLVLAEIRRLSAAI